MKFASSKLSPLLLFCFALGTAGCATQGTTLGAKFDDTVITTKVKAALYDDPDVRGSAVKVQTVNGIVQLSGFVASQTEAKRAVDIARGVDHVNEVKNNMTIRN